MTVHVTRAGEPRVVVERYEVRAGFHCARCGRDWTRRYEVRDYRGPDGRRWVIHCREGVPVRGPAFGSRCPRCHAVSLQMVPAPHHHHGSEAAGELDGSAATG